MSDKFNTPESWLKAKKYSAVFGEVPSSFSSAIRTLIADQTKLGGTLSSGAAFLVSRLLIGPSMKAPFYYATLTYHSEQLSNAAHVNTKKLASMFPPYDIAVIVGLLYLFRRAKKFCESQENQWAFLVPPLLRDIDLGGMVGEAIPKIGRGSGMIVGALPGIALGAMIAADKNGAKEYIRFLKAEKKSFDPDWEMEKWGCTTIQVGSLLMQGVGFGIEFANSMSLGFTPGTTLDEGRAPEVYRAYITQVWIKALAETGDVPDITHSGNYYPLKVALGKLLYEANNIKEKGSKFSWITKNKDDISPEATPQLFEESVREAKAAEQAAAAKIDLSKPISISDLPKEVLDLFAKEELEQMSQDELKEILKQAMEA